MKKSIINILILFTIFSSALYAKSDFINPIQMKQLRMQVSPQQWQRAYATYKSILPQYEQIQKEYPLRVLYSKKHKVVSMYLMKIKNIYLQHKNIITAWILMQSYLRTSDIHKKTTFYKYMYPAIEMLYNNQICQGYIFKGFAENFYQENKNSAEQIYQTGIVRCKVSWQRLMLQSRLNILKYQH